MSIPRLIAKLGIAMVASIALQSTVSAQTVLFTTQEDFALFLLGTATTSIDNYSEFDFTNGVGNTVDAGGPGTPGSLELTAVGGWNVTEMPGPTQDAFTAVTPGSIRPWTPESGFGPGTMMATSGTIEFDFYAPVPFPSWWDIGFNLNYDGNYGAFFGTRTDFVGADGNTWTHFSIPYTTNATSLNYFGMGLIESSDGVSTGTVFYIDNIQVTAVPEPSTIALLVGGLGAVIVLRRRASRCVL